MNRQKIFTPFVAFLTFSCVAQNENVTSVDLEKLINAKKFSIFNRSASLLIDPQYRNGIHLNEKEGYGVIWLNNLNCRNGVIEFDVKGKNEMQKSFVGIAFHGLNDSTMDAIYFRPFNFQAPDTERKSHSVQYISLPAYDWQILRTGFPNKYEHSLNFSPQPNDWFHVRVVINAPKVSVYVNRESSPDLVIDQLSNRKEGKIGFWVGNESGGDFANLKITLQ